MVKVYIAEHLVAGATEHPRWQALAAFSNVEYAKWQIEKETSFLSDISNHEWEVNERGTKWTWIFFAMLQGEEFKFGWRIVEMEVDFFIDERTRTLVTALGRFGKD